MKAVQGAMPRFASAKVIKHDRSGSARELYIRLKNDEQGNDWDAYRSLLMWPHYQTVQVLIKSGSDPQVELKQRGEYHSPTAGQFAVLDSLLDKAEFDAEDVKKNYPRDYRRDLVAATVAKVRATVPENIVFQVMLRLLERLEQRPQGEA